MCLPLAAARKYAFIICMHLLVVITMHLLMVLQYVHKLLIESKLLEIYLTKMLWTWSRVLSEVSISTKQHAQVQWSHSSMGLTQAHPNYALNYASIFHWGLASWQRHVHPLASTTEVHVDPDTSRSSKNLLVIEKCLLKQIPSPINTWNRCPT